MFVDSKIKMLWHVNCYSVLAHATRLHAESLHSLQLEDTNMRKSIPGVTACTQITKADPKRESTQALKNISHTILAGVISVVGFTAAWADEPPAVPAVPAAAPAAPTPPALLPAFSGSVAANSKPTMFDAGPLGNIFITGVVSGFAQSQNNVFPGDHSNQVDISNAQIFINKSTGLVQFFAQAGAYSLPDIGLPYLKAANATGAFYGPLPQWYLKLAPSDDFSVEVGNLPTLIGAEYTFSFENLNIERGLLWNQENAVNRGIQFNYTKGPLLLSASWNDGMYSGEYTWAWLSATYTVSPTDTVAVIASGSTRHTSVSTLVTPLYQNNEQLYNVIYTHTMGQWTIEPYLQYTYVPAIPSIGALHQASTLGAALFVNYAFDAKSSLAGFSTPVRVEYLGSTGSVADGAPNLMYGPGSKAWSITVTPTYQVNAFFFRLELSYVGTMDTTPGLAFGPAGNDKSQSRAMVEGGFVF